MKKSIHLTLTFFLFSILSCSTNKQLQMQLKEDVNNSKEDIKDCFVQYSDGSVESFTTLKLITGALKTPYLLGDNKKKIYARGVRAYQNQTHYAISQELLSTSSRSYVAVETLPGFAVRIAKGKLNIYDRKYYNSQRLSDEFFVQYGENGDIVKYSPALLLDIIKTSPEALDFFNSRKYSSFKPKKIQITAEIYNNSAFISKN